MTKKLFFEAILKFVLGVLLVAATLFLPAGTLTYVNAWLFLGILFLPMFGAGLVMMVKNPSLLRKRLQGKEKQREQGILVKLSGLMFLAGFLIAGLGVRFQWYMLPNTVVIPATVIFLFSYLLYAEVLRENTYLSRTIQVQEEQKVIDSGLYGIIRHPMYTATIFLFLSMPLVLGSIYAFLIFLMYPVLIIQRLKKEEEFLEKELEGYQEYKKKVKYRLFPFVW